MFLIVELFSRVDFTNISSAVFVLISRLTQFLRLWGGSKIILNLCQVIFQVPKTKMDTSSATDSRKGLQVLACKSLSQLEPFCFLEIFASFRRSEKSELSEL